MCCTKRSSVINLIYSGHLLFSYIVFNNSFGKYYIFFTAGEYISTLGPNLIFVFIISPFLSRKLERLCLTDTCLRLVFGGLYLGWLGPCLKTFPWTEMYGNDDFLTNETVQLTERSE
jgi:hypothetical protein